MEPDEGEVFVGGFDMRRQPDRAREQLGYLSQRFSLYDDLTVLENLRFFAEVRGLSADDWKPRTLEILEFVGLAEFTDRLAKNLSGGMKQKLGLATALVHRPAMLLLDEPSGGVDPVTRQDFWQLIIKLVAEEGVGVLVSTPYMDEVSRCTHVGMMQAGQIVLEGSPESIRQHLEGQVLELRGSPLPGLRALAGKVEHIEDVHSFGDRLHLRIHKGTAEKVIKAIKKDAKQSGFTIDHLEQTTPHLEDVFISLLAEQQSQIASPK
jgi:ABC-2 type transport system ATP-binding protein